MIKQNILAKNLTPNTVLFMDDQVLMQSTEVELQRAACTLNNMAIKYNLKIYLNKTKAMALKGKMNVSTKVVINNIILEQAT
jgi:hypothetical protein